MQQQLLLEYNKVDSNHSGDRISLLPDDIIILILSFLSRKEAAVTSLLSRRWRHMWAFTTRLDFVVKNWRSECLHNNMKWSSKRFVKEVNQVLRLHRGSALEEFGLSFCLNENFKQEIDNWLKLASAKRVQKLKLDFYAPVRCSADVTIENYNLSYGVLNQNNGTSSKTMSSSLCMIECCQFAGFESLKVLCLRSVNVTGEILEGFLSRCPSLEKLTVEDSWSQGLVHLKVQGPSLALKYLEIKTCPNLSAVEICNVNLVTLVYVGREISWVLHNTPALVNLTIGGGACMPLSLLWFTQLSHCLSQLETLTIGYTECLGINVGDVPFELSNLKNLNLNVLMDGDRSVLGFMPLIKASPNLQRFVFKSSWFQPTFERRKIRRVEKLPLKHIEEMEFRGYYGNTSHLEILAFFLENAVSVKKIIVDPNEAYNPEAYTGAETERKVKTARAARGRAMRQLKGIMLQGAEIKIL